jgi:hypothetical protein
MTRRDLVSPLNGTQSDLDRDHPSLRKELTPVFLATRTQRNAASGDGLIILLIWGGRKARVPIARAPRLAPPATVPMAFLLTRPGR